MTEAEANAHSPMPETSRDHKTWKDGYKAGWDDAARSLRAYLDQLAAVWKP